MKAVCIARRSREYHFRHIRAYACRKLDQLRSPKVDEAGCLLFHHDRGARREQGTGQRGDRVDQQHRCLGQNPENRTDEDQGRAVAVHSIWYRSLSTASGIVYTSHTVLGEPQTSTKPRRMPKGTAQIQLQQPPAAVGEHKVLVFQVPQKTPPRAEVRCTSTQRTRGWRRKCKCQAANDVHHTKQPKSRQ